MGRKKKEIKPRPYKIGEDLFKGLVLDLDEDGKIYIREDKNNDVK